MKVWEFRSRQTSCLVPLRVVRPPSVDCTYGTGGVGEVRHLGYARCIDLLDASFKNDLLSHEFYLIRLHAHDVDRVFHTRRYVRKGTGSRATGGVQGLKRGSESTETPEG